MTSKTQKYLINIIGCLAFLSIPVLSSPDLDRGFEMLTIKPFLGYLLRYSLLIVLFYLNYFYFFPKFYLANKKASFIVICLISFSILVYFPNLLIEHGKDHPMPMMGDRPMHNPNFIWFFDTQILISYLLVLALSLLIRMNTNLSKIRTEKLHAEVSFLKAQINPHFLFNTLNSLYALTLEKSNEAPQAVLKLSSMMRYVVTESAVDFVTLEKELNHINDYIALQKLRLDSDAQLHVSISGNPVGKVIAPLLLIPFIENAFKYGINPDADSRVEIVIKIMDNSLSLFVKNTIVNTIVDDDFKTEKGLENTLKRLEYVYPNRHSLTLLENTSTYEVTLQITLV